MKILFTNPPGFEVGKDGELRKWVRAGSRWPHSYPAACRQDQWAEGQYTPFPFFMAYAASYAAKHTGADVIVRDSVALNEGYSAYYTYIKEASPDVIFLESASPSWEMDAGIIRKIAQYSPASKIAVCGPITASKSAEILSSLPVVACIKGEYEKGAVRVINGETGVLEHHLLTSTEMNAAPFPIINANEAWRYFDGCPGPTITPQAHVWSSRGCPHKCLSGDTPINTTRGLIPIRELVGKAVGVFTYDREERRAKIVTVSDIRKTGERQKLVRVRFDDGSHIDCTPDHRFLTFRWGNQHVGEREWLMEAKDMTPGTRIRSLSVSESNGYPIANWNRRGRMAIHRMVAEWKLNRALKPGEIAHHIDHDKRNWSPDNIEVVGSTAEHFDRHPEIAGRMRNENPTANGLSEQWRARISSSNRGKIRSIQSRDRYRAAAIVRESKKTTEQKRIAADRMVAGSKQSRAWENRSRTPAGCFNHKVISVEELPGEHDTFCMEVPGTHLFFANNMVVRNCIFCVWPAVMTGNDPDGEHKRSVRFYTPDYMEAFLTEIVARHRFRTIYFDDDTFNLGNKHTQAMCAVMRKINLPWAAMCRADTSTPETWTMMRDSGCYGVKLGFESGNQHVVDNIVNKGLDLKEARQTVIYLRRLGMNVHGTFTYGLPGETAEQRKETKAYIRTLPLTSLQESGTAEIEGTPLHSLRTAGHLDAYAAAKMAGFDGEGDGVKKFAAIRDELSRL